MDRIISLALDALIIVIVWVAMKKAARRGLIRTVLQSIGYVASLIVSSVASKVVAIFLYDTVLQKPLTRFLSDKIASSMSDIRTSAGLEALLNSSAFEFLGKFGVDARAASSEIISIAESSGASMANAAADVLVKPWAIAIIGFVSFLVLFGLCSIAVNVLVYMFKTVDYIPAIGSLNSMLGGVVGIIQGLLLVFVFSIAVNLVIIFTENGFWLINNTVVEQTFLLKYLTHFNLFDLLAK